MIKIGDALLDASLVRSGDRLTISTASEMSLDELMALLEPASAPEVRVLGDEGLTEAIYKSHAVTALTLEVQGGVRRATATLQVEPLAQSEADRLQEQLARAEGILGEHDAALCEVAGMAADGQTLTAEAEDALCELAELYAALAERMEALEQSRGAAEDGMQTDEQGKEEA